MKMSKLAFSFGKGAGMGALMVHVGIRLVSALA